MTTAYKTAREYIKLPNPNSALDHVLVFILTLTVPSFAVYLLGSIRIKKLSLEMPNILLRIRQMFGSWLMLEDVGISLCIFGGVQDI